MSHWIINSGKKEIKTDHLLNVSNGWNLSHYLTLYILVKFYAIYVEDEWKTVVSWFESIFHKSFRCPSYLYVFYPVFNYRIGQIERKTKRSRSCKNLRLTKTRNIYLRRWSTPFFYPKHSHSCAYVVIVKVTIYVCLKWCACVLKMCAEFSSAHSSLSTFWCKTWKKVIQLAST